MYSTFTKWNALLKRKGRKRGREGMRRFSMYYIGRFPRSIAQFKGDKKNKAETVSNMGEFLHFYLHVFA